MNRLDRIIAYNNGTAMHACDVGQCKTIRHQVPFRVVSRSDRAVGHGCRSLSSLLEPRYLGEPLLLERRDVAGVYRRRYGLTGEPASKVAWALTSSSYRIAGVFLLIRTELGCILTC